jgi:hypothetical protein
MTLTKIIANGKEGDFNFLILDDELRKLRKYC